MDEEYRKKVEKRILNIMEKKLVERQMTAERAVSIARYILNTLKPHMTIEQIHTVALEFDDRFAELAPITQIVTLEHEEEVKQKIVPMVEKLLKAGNISEAADIVSSAKNKK